MPTATRCDTRLEGLSKIGEYSSNSRTSLLSTTSFKRGDTENNHRCQIATGLRSRAIFGNSVGHRGTSELRGKVKGSKRQCHREQSFLFVPGGKGSNLQEGAIRGATLGGPIAALIQPIRNNGNYIFNQEKIRTLKEKASVALKGVSVKATLRGHPKRCIGEHCTIGGRSTLGGPIAALIQPIRNNGNYIFNQEKIRTLKVDSEGRRDNSVIRSTAMSHK